MTKGETAKNNFKNGYNCAQAVLMAFGGETGLNPETAALISCGFGGGIGRQREVCGAVSGMVLAADLMYGYSDKGSNGKKAAHYELVQKLCAEFKKSNGSFICRELLAGVTDSTNPHPEERTSEYYKKRPCADIVECAANILEEYKNGHI